MSKALRYFQVGLLCVQEGSEDRPSMAQVIVMLSSDSAMLGQPNRPGIYVARSGMEAVLFSSEYTITILEGR